MRETSVKSKALTGLSSGSSLITQDALWFNNATTSNAYTLTTANSSIH